MWVLTNPNTAECFYLIPEKAKYTVGRVGADLVVDDKSISRMHAHLHVTSETLTLEDVGSKYGTFHNEGIAAKDAIAKRTHILLRAGDRIQFGVLENLWSISKRALASIVSALPREQTAQLEKKLNALGGRLLSRWDDNCTTHLTMNEVTITVKVLYALLQQIPIVSCNYWSDLLEAARFGSGPLPEIKNYEPHQCEEMLKTHHDVDLSARPERQRLFAGTTFVFMNRKHFEIYAPIVQKAGGTCKDLKAGVQKPFLLRANVLVVQYVSSTESQGSQTISSIEQYLESHSRRLIPEYEIGLAIIHCSTIKYCNPTYKILSDVIPPSSMSAVLVASDDENEKEADLIENTHSPPKLISASTDILVPETEQSNADSSSKVVSPQIASIRDKDDDEYECDMANMCVTESAGNEQSKKKRSRELVDDNDEDNNENLFHFAKKTHLDKSTEKPSTSIASKTTQSFNDEPLPIVINAERPAPDMYGFFGKSQTGTIRSGIEQPRNTETVDTNTRKRQRIAVLSDGDDEDNLFSFGGASAAKSSRMHNDNNSDGNLFGFTKNASKDCVDRAVASLVVDDDDDDYLEPTETFVPKSKPKSVVKAGTIKVPKPKQLPQAISTAGWLSCSLNKMEIKGEPKSHKADGDEEPKTTTENEAKTATESEPKTEVNFDVAIKKEEEIEENYIPLWVNALKGGFHVRKCSVNTSTCSKNVASHNQSDLSIQIYPKDGNFKAFVKKCNPFPQQKVITTVRASSFPLRLR